MLPNGMAPNALTLLTRPVVFERSAARFPPFPTPKTDVSRMPPPSPVLRLAGVRKSFGATQALRGVSLEVGAGEVHALIGENGAGKSTLMRILSGAHAPDAGEIELDGRPYRPAKIGRAHV